MGIKSSLLVYADSSVREALSARPQLDREATFRLAQKLFPNDPLVPLEDVNLWYIYPPGDELYIGCFHGVFVIVADEVGLSYPSKLPQAFIEAGGNRNIYLHSSHSVSNFFAYAVWSNRTLVRSLSMSSDDGILEDIGPRLSFEEPFWAGQHREVDEEEELPRFYNMEELPDSDRAEELPFYPLDMAEAALRELFGYVYDVNPDASFIDLSSISLMQYKRTRSL